MTTVGTFASLINSKVVVPSTRNDYWAVNKHFLSDLLSTRLNEVPVDQPWYLLRYPDVAKAIETGTVVDAAEHYRKYGYFEHRMPRRIHVNEEWYLKEYADVGTAVKERVFPSAQAHFDLVGYAEGRLPHANFILGAGPDGRGQVERQETRRVGRPLAGRTAAVLPPAGEALAGTQPGTDPGPRSGAWRRSP